VEKEIRDIYGRMEESIIQFETMHKALRIVRTKLWTKLTIENLEKLLLPWVLIICYFGKGSG